MSSCTHLVPYSDRRPVNFMLYLETLHILCLPSQTSFLPPIQWNGKDPTAAQISVISLRNRFENGERGGSSCDHLQIRLYSRFMLDLNIITERKWNISCSSLWLNMSCIWPWELRGVISSSFTQPFRYCHACDLETFECPFKMTFTAETFRLKYVQAKSINLDIRKRGRRNGEEAIRFSCA